MFFGGYTIAYIGQAVVPAADAYAAGITSDVFNMANFHAGAFVIQQGAIEDSGISNLVKVLSADDTTPSNTSAIGFRYRLYVASTDTWGAEGTATSSGYNFNAASAVSNGIHVVYFTADEVRAAAGYSYVQLSIAETANKTVTAGVTFYGLEGRYHGTPPGAVA